ncbi:MAG: ABC transporter ATP-binding protein [Lachnospiraceae bacterium]|nr:ABC transporter ATP-binding protein [Lachnospiraceae bacterium]
MNEILTCYGLTKRYSNGFPAIDNITLNLNAGRIIGLLGPNGSGKTTLIKMICGLLTPTAGSLYVAGLPVGPQTKAIISYLPDQTYLNDWMTVHQIIDYFADFYADFDVMRAYEMLTGLQIDPNNRLKTMSKGTREKVQLILVMSRRARFYVLDEPIAGVDPAARDYILSTIVSNVDPGATVLISTHLISDIEHVLHEAVFLQQGRVALYDAVENIRKREGKSVDELFREVYRCLGN